MKKIKADELKGRELEVLEDGTLRLIENKSKKFIPNVGEEYWYIGSLGGIEYASNDKTDYDIWALNHNLVFKTEGECKEYRSFLDLLDEYRCELDWKDSELKYNLYYNEYEDFINSARSIYSREQGSFYFESEEKIKEFIEKAGKDNIKRFMFDVWE